FASTGAYDYPNQCFGSGCPSTAGWSLTSPEWKSASFEEGLATFFGDVANYWLYAPEPTTCLSTSYCDTSIEKSSGKFNCVTDEDRWALSTDRYLWDVYDTPDDYDATPGYLDDVSVPYWQFFTTLESYPTGFGDHACDEPWKDSSYSSIDNFDGRDQYDF